MNKEEFVGAIAASMSNKTSSIQVDDDLNPINSSAEAEAERVEEMRQKVDDDAFIINIPMITGRVYKIDAREVNWAELGTPESQKNLEQNEGIIRSMVAALITADFADPKTENMVKDFDESVMNLFANFGIQDPGYDEMEQKTMARPYVMLLGKCFDALTLINVIAHNTAMHGLAQQVFGIAKDFDEITNLNEITDMDNAAEGIITEDRTAFGEFDDHDVSGLVSD